MQNSMMMRLAISGAAVLFAICLLASAPAVAAEVKVGVLAPRGELSALTQWAEFGKYLSAEIGHPVKIIPLPPPRVVSTMAAGEVDLVMANPMQTVILKEQHAISLLATLSGESGPEFAGVIVAKKGSGINQASDLRGKRVMSMDSKTAAGAYLFQAYHLQQQGIDVRKDLSLKEGKKQDDFVLAVRAGVIDAAFVRTGLLEDMAEEGKITMDEFVIVDQQPANSFPYRRSTVLYPEWFLCASAALSPEVAEKIKAAVLKQMLDTPAAKAAGIKGFIPPLPLDSAKAAMQAMKIPPYDR